MKDFEAVYSEYYDIVFHYMCSLCKDEGWAKEVTQEAFLKALSKIDGFHGECKLSVWLCQIAKNTFYTEAKKKKRETTQMPLEAISNHDNIEQNMITKEGVMELHKVLHTLDEPYKEVFWMRTFGEMSFKEIGVIFEKTESWARVTYHRAKMKIKEGVQ